MSKTGWLPSSSWVRSRSDLRATERPTKTATVPGISRGKSSMYDAPGAGPRVPRKKLHATYRDEAS
jgi:hypothetical protein